MRWKAIAAINFIWLLGFFSDKRIFVHFKRSKSWIFHYRNLENLTIEFRFLRKVLSLISHYELDFESKYRFSFSKYFCCRISSLKLFDEKFPWSWMFTTCLVNIIFLKSNASSLAFIYSSNALNLTDIDQFPSFELKTYWRLSLHTQHSRLVFIASIHISRLAISIEAKIILKMSQAKRTRNRNERVCPVHMREKQIERRRICCSSDFDRSVICCR